jgi:bifunctional DNase/RNase
MIEKIPDDAEFLRNLKSTQDFELVEIDFYKVTVDAQEGQVIALFTSEKKIVGIEFNSIEGTMLTFVASGCYENSHLRTIYQIYLETLNLIKFEIDKVVIESKQGDMLYARMHLVDHKGRKIFKVCSAGDGVILATMADCKTYVVKNVYDSMDDYTDYDQKLSEEYE